MFAAATPAPASRPIAFPWERALLLLIVLYLAGRELLPSIAAFAQSGPGSPPASRAIVPPATAFTYQGRVTLDGVPANGAFDLAFNLWDAPTAGNLQASDGPSATTITNGLFTATLDFALPYSEGKSLYIETIIDPPGASPAVSLGRTPLTVAPHDHLYQDWFASSDNAALSLRNFGSGSALYLEGGAGPTLDVNGSSNAAAVNINAQGGGPGLSVSGGSQYSITAAGQADSATIRGTNSYGSCALFAGCQGVQGNSILGAGVAGYGKIGVLGTGNNGVGVYGISDTAGKPAVKGETTLINGCSSAAFASLCFAVEGDASGANGNAGVGLHGVGTYAGLVAEDSGPGSYAAMFFGLTITDDILPGAVNFNNLGDPTFRWKNIYAQNPVNVLSDRRAKTDITPLAYGLDEILRLDPVSYRWSEGDDASTHLGLIAQDVRPIVPEAVFGSEADGMLSMDPTALIPVLIRAIQQQQAQIDALRLAAE